MGRDAIQAEGRRDEHAIEPGLIIDNTGACGGLEASCKGEVERMDEELVKEFWRLMKDKDVSEFLLAIFIEWVRKTARRRVAG